MIIFLEELVLQLFLWLLSLVDGMMEIFSAIAGITDVTYHGNKVNIIEHIVSQTSIGTVFWCVFILSIGITAIFTIAAIVKNMITNNRNLSTIVGKFFLALLGTMAMLAVVILGILISNSVLVLVSHIFQVENTTKLSNALFNACVGNGWINGYSMAEVNVTSQSVRSIVGNYHTATFGIWPDSWQLDGMIDPDKFLYFPALVASVGIMIALLISVINLAKRLFEIVLLYIIMPLSISTLPLDDGARFKVWRETFITKIVVAYGAVFSVNVFALVLPIVTKMQIENLLGFGNGLFVIFLMIGGAMMIPAAQYLFARLFGQADDMHAGGSFLRSAFYGGRIASAMTLGVAGKLMKGVKDKAGKKKTKGADFGQGSNRNNGGGRL